MQASLSLASESITPSNCLVEGYEDIALTLEDALLNAHRENDVIVGYGIYKIDDIENLTERGLRNSDRLIAVCETPVTEITEHNRKACCGEWLTKPILIFTTIRERQIINVPIVTE